VIAWLLVAGACMNQPATTAPPSETDRLLELVALAIQATNAEQKRDLEAVQALAYQAWPTNDNLLAWTIVRAFTASLPAALHEVRGDLQVLSNAREELTAGQRHLALVVLTQVEDRLRLGGQIIDLQRQIDSLTEIEASLNPPEGEHALEVQQ
jgi:hypothetical protein